MKGNFKTAKKTARGSAPGYDALIMGCARKANCDRIDTVKVGHFRATAPDLESQIWRARSARLPDDARLTARCAIVSLLGLLCHTFQIIRRPSSAIAAASSAGCAIAR